MFLYLDGKIKNISIKLKMHFTFCGESEGTKNVVYIVLKKIIWHYFFRPVTLGNVLFKYNLKVSGAEQINEST